MNPIIVSFLTARVKAYHLEFFGKGNKRKIRDKYIIRVRGRASIAINLSLMRENLAMTSVQGQSARTDSGSGGG